MTDFIYHLVATDHHGRLHSTYTDLLSLQSLVTGVELSPRLRNELQGQPKLLGYCGPMWDGYGYILDDGESEPDIVSEWAASGYIKETYKKVGVIRYETQYAYNKLSK